MFLRQEMQALSDVFLPKSKRRFAGAYFGRVIGYDNEILSFMAQYYQEVKKTGIYLNKTLSNPTRDEVNYFYSRVKEEFQVTQESIYRAVCIWLRSVGEKEKKLLSEGIFTVLFAQQKTEGSLNILKNAFIKYMCWSRYIFEPAVMALLEDAPPKILYEGEIAKYELNMLWILNCAGCDVIYANFLSEDSYIKLDASSSLSTPFYGKNQGTPFLHFTEVASRDTARVEKNKAEMSAVTSTVETNSWVFGGFLEAVFSNMEKRGSERKIYNFFGQYIGYDGTFEEYQNMLFQFRQKLQWNKAPVLLLEGKIMNPTIDEASAAPRAKYTSITDVVDSLVAGIQISDDKTTNALIMRAVQEVLSEDHFLSPDMARNHGIRLLAWLKRYRDILFLGRFQEHPPVVLYYGAAGENEAQFLTLLSMLPVDVVYFCPDKEAKNYFDQWTQGKKALLHVCGKSMPAGRFPEREVKLKAATTAYQAERDLDEILYNGTGLFRNRQFVRSKPVTLRTTYDEIGILWKQEAKYRPSFQVDANQVTVPNLFAKICGVEDGNATAYFKKIESMLTENTILITKIPFITEIAPNAMKGSTYGFLQNGRIQPGEIKRQRNYTYDYISEDTQDYMLDKMQELLDLNWIKGSEPHLDTHILSVLLNLDKKTIRMIQQFDFTSEIPKVVVIDVDEAMLSLFDCIYLSYLNLVGFDIAVFTPTGYRNLEKYIKEDAYEEHMAGKYLFNLTVPPLDRHKASAKEMGLFGRLFLKGRKL